jgi:hypothetical protein
MATALLIAGGGLAIAGKIKEGQIAAAQGDLEKEIQGRNQQALNRQADAEKAASKVEESRIARRSKIVQARLAVGVSKSGIGLAGASLEALTDAAFQFSLDRSLTLRAGLIKSRELRQRGGILAAQGRFAKTIGRQRRTSAFFSAAGTGLLTAGTLGSSGSNIGSPPSPINNANIVPGARGGL